MKKLIALLMTAALLLGLTACIGSGENNPTIQPETTSTETQVPIDTPAPEPTTQVVEAITDPDFDADALFKRLEGYWNGNSGHPGFTAFIYKDGKPSLWCGAYDGEHSGYGALTGGNENANEAMATLYFLYPAFDDVDGPVPKRTSELQIDLLDIANEKLRVQHTTIWMTYEWESFTYGGKTMEEAREKAFSMRDTPANLRWNEALLAELGMTYKELIDKYGPRTGQDGDAIQFENGPGSYSFGNWVEKPTPTDRCIYIVVPAKKIFLGLTGPVAKEDFLATLGIRDGDGYGPVLKDGYKHNTVMHFGDPLDSYQYQLSIWHNEKNAFRGDDLVGVFDPSIN